jgi:hypothetical protein
MTLHLDLDLEPDPETHVPRGRLAAAGSEPVAFSGWLALIAALERALAAGPESR